MEASDTAWILPKARLDELIALLQAEGFDVIGPTIQQSAIIYDTIRCADDLPIGWTDRQSAGSYRLERREDAMYFGFAVGPHSWKKFLFPPSHLLWRARRTDDGFVIQHDGTDPPKLAFLGVRSCDLHAIAVQDRVFLNRDQRYTDPHYATVRERALIIAVECEVPGGTCFCTSMGTGPEIQPERIPLPLLGTNGDTPVAFDLAMIELEDGFIVRAATPAGEQLVSQLGLSPATAEQIDDARQRVQHCAESMQKSVDITDIRNLLHRNQEHPRWDHVAQRCLACTNCTLVCPTCFCSSVQDVNDLSLENVERIRHWDSCFNPDFAQVHGGNFRISIRGRYRQWLTHKFASWYDQFGVSGCIGCGRCITWCPVEIDVTEEITAIRQTDCARAEMRV